MKRTLLAFAVLALSCHSAWAIKFKSDTYQWKTVSDHVYYIDLNQFVVDIDRTRAIHWSADALPKWLALNPDTGVLSGKAFDDSVTEMFSIFAVQGNSADVAHVYLRVEPANANVHNNPVWMVSRLEIESCVGRAIATRNLQNSVMLSNPGPRLPMPAIEISALGAPAWVVPIRKADSYFLSGVPTEAGESQFRMQACADGNCNTVPASIQVKAQCP